MPSLTYHTSQFVGLQKRLLSYVGYILPYWLCNCQITGYSGTNKSTKWIITVDKLNCQSICCWMMSIIYVTVTLVMEKFTHNLSKYVNPKMFIQQWSQILQCFSIGYFHVLIVALWSINTQLSIVSSLLRGSEMLIGEVPLPWKGNHPWSPSSSKRSLLKICIIWVQGCTLVLKGILVD